MSVLLQERKVRGWTRARLAAELAQLMSADDRRYPITEAQIGRWERGESKPTDYWVEKLCAVCTKSAEELGLYRRASRREADPAGAESDAEARAGPAVLTQYLPRASPTDATAPEVYGPPADEGLLPVPEHFIGREEELRWLVDHLRRGGVTGITAVQGLGGIGKTSLAAVAVRRLREENRFRDGVGVVVCLGQTDAVQVLRAILSRFDPQRRLPSEATMAQLCDVAHRLLTNRDVLVVLDNVEPELGLEGIRGPLNAVRATLLLTSRTHLDVGESLDLPLLTADQAGEAFALYYGKPSAAAFAPSEAAAVARIVEDLGRHTLAVKIAARYALGTRRKLTLLADELHDPHGVLAIADAIDRIFIQSLEVLPQPAQRLFAACGAFATPEFGRKAALALASALGLAQPQSCVDLLVQRALMEAVALPDLPDSSDVERLQLHPLLRAFASERLRAHPEAFADLARRAIAAYYADYASRPLRAALGPDEINITEALIWAHERRLDELVTRICLGMQAFWRDYGRAGQTQRYVPWGMEAADAVARETGTREARLALATLRLAYVHLLRLTGKLGEAEALAQLVLPAFREAGDLPGVGSALTALGNIARDRAQFEVAEAQLEEALAIFRDEQVNDVSGQGLILCFLGQIAQRRGRTELAERQLRESLATYRTVQDRWGIGLALILLGRIPLQRGRLDEAAALYEEALAIHQALQARRSVGADISSLGEISLGLGHLEQAEKQFVRSLAILADSRDRRGEAVDCTFLGKLTGIRGRLDESDEWLRRAAAIWREVQDPRGSGWVMSEQARLALACGRPAEAERLLTQSLAIRRRVDDRRGEAADLRVLGEMALERGEVAPAEALLRQAEGIATEIEDGPEEARIRLALAAVAATRGEPEHAEAQAHAALDLATALRSSREVAQAQVALAELLVARDRIDEGRRLLRRAAQHYGEMGIPLPQGARGLMRRTGCENAE